MASETSYKSIKINGMETIENKVDNATTFDANRESPSYISAKIGVFAPAGIAITETHTPKTTPVKPRSLRAATVSKGNKIFLTAIP